MQIDHSIYSLTPKTKLNRFKNKIRTGVLLRVDKEFFLDYHPWEEFGDLNINEMLHWIKTNKALPDFLMQALKLEQNKANIQINSFLNHELYNEKEFCNDSPVVKIKFHGEFDKLNNSLGLIKNKKLRIDFNNGSNLEELINWWNGLTIELKSAIEYIEDPFVLIGDNWKPLKDQGIPLACDRNQIDLLNCEFLIFKPNVDTFKNLEIKTIFSSYMGHDLGRFHAYLALMKFGDISLYHGINTPQIYEDQIEIFKSFEDNKTTIDSEKIKKMFDTMLELSWTNLI